MTADAPGAGACRRSHCLKARETERGHTSYLSFAVRPARPREPSALELAAAEGVQGGDESVAREQSVAGGSGQGQGGGGGGGGKAVEAGV